MTVPIGKILFAALFLLTSLCTEAALSDPGNNRIAKSSAQNPARPGMMWQILPGEDIRETAQLIYPNNPAARDNLIRAIIRSNPQHFPDAKYQPLTAGTIIHFPDLRTIGAYAKTTTRSHKTPTVKESPKNQPHATSPTKVAKTGSDPQLTRLIAQLDREAETESLELNTLIQHIGLLETRLHEFQTLLEAKTLHVNDPPVITHAESSEHIEETIATSNEDTQPFEESKPPSAVSTPQTEIESQPEELPVAAEPTLAPEENQLDSASHAETTPPPQTDITQQAANISTFDETPDSFLDDILSPDTILLIAILLTILIVLVMLRSYRKIRDRHAHASDIVTVLDNDERRRYEALFLRQDENNAQPANIPTTPTEQIAAEARALIEQDKTDEAIQTLQKQLAGNQQNIPGWLMLFELLYKTNNKRDFKKNARRFKRLNQSPDIWVQIQDLGHRLESNEPLYFNEQKRKEKFFSDASAAE